MARSSPSSERTRTLRPYTSSGTDNRAPWDDHNNLLKELEFYDPALLDKPRLVVANKMDEPAAEENLKNVRLMRAQVGQQLLIHQRPLRAPLA